ncbi:MAG: hypothetical protein ACXWQ5_20955 [Ktedonobacterales bacterium]
MAKDESNFKEPAASTSSDAPLASPPPGVSRRPLTPGALTIARPSAPPHFPDQALLRSLRVDPATVVSAQPVQGGLSGARLTRLTLRHVMPGGAAYYSSRVLKALPPSSGWLGAAARDTQVREAQLWLHGLLQTLPAQVETAIRSAALKGPAGAPEIGALLLRDVRGRLLPHPVRTPPGRQPRIVAMLLDAMAHLHARYWQDAGLDDPALGLMPLDAALLLLAPQTIAAARASGDPSFYLPMAQAGWDAFFRLAHPDDAATLRSVLQDPDCWLASIAALPKTLVHGDIWGPNLGMLPATRSVPRKGRRLLLLDWALALAGPATFDPLWLCGTWHALDPVRILAAYRARLQRHLAARGLTLSSPTWQSLADAGYLRTALTCGEALGRTATEAPPGASRRTAEARVRWWAHRAARAAHRLVHTESMNTPQ